jgi:hypothetical protein
MMTEDRHETSRPLTDVELRCKDCRCPFWFSVGEQQFFAERGYTHTPVRCRDCRRSRRARFTTWPDRS